MSKRCGSIDTVVLRCGAVILASGALLAGCSAIESAATGPAQTVASDRGTRQRAVTDSSVLDIFRDDGRSASPTQTMPGGANVNRYLWQASLDTLSFMPLASTDPFSGVIATDWATNPQSPGERFKVTAYVTDVALTPAALRVAVFREEQGRDGAWLAAPVSAETPRQIEDAILVRARQLRIAERADG